MSDPHTHLRETDLAPLVAEHGELHVEPAEDFFRRFVTAIIRQQVSMASASATRERLFDAIEVSPRGVQAATDDLLRDAGLSRQKTRYVNNVADAFVEHGWSRDHFADVPDDEVRDELTSVTGVGEWTANMQLIFSLGREDVFPVGDLGIRKGMWRLYDDPDLTRAEMRDRAAAWRPYRSYASRYLWKIEDGD